MDKATLKKLQAFFQAVIDEAESNEPFARKITEALYGESDSCPPANEPNTKRRSNRRDPAVLDPVQMVMSGDTSLKERLEALSMKELKDIIADHGMDSSRLAMKWKDKNRLITLILDTAERRASKGDAFRD